MELQGKFLQFVEICMENRGRLVSPVFHILVVNTSKET